jgi:hypothetical protein
LLLRITTVFVILLTSGLLRCGAFNFLTTAAALAALGSLLALSALGSLLALGPTVATTQVVVGVVVGSGYS